MHIARNPIETRSFRKNGCIEKFGRRPRRLGRDCGRGVQLDAADVGSTAGETDVYYSWLLGLESL